MYRAQRYKISSFFLISIYDLLWNSFSFTANFLFFFFSVQKGKLKSDLNRWIIGIWHLALGNLVEQDFTLKDWMLDGCLLII